MTSLDVTNLTFKDPKTCYFLLSALNDCGNLNLTVVYFRFNIQTVETESQLFQKDWEISIFVCIILIPAVLLITITGATAAKIKFSTKEKYSPQQPREMMYSMHSDSDRTRLKKSEELVEPQTHRPNLNMYSPLAYNRNGVILNNQI
jgi:hypothetical protein